MKTSHRILTVAVLLVTGAVLGASKILEIDRQNAWNAMSTSNLKQISLAWTMYADDWNDTFPNLSDAQSMKQVLAPYLGGSEKPFLHPKTGQPYQPNSSLTYQKRKSPNASAYIVAVYEADPAQDGTRGVLFTDGHADRVNEPVWQKLKKTSNIP